MTVIRAILKLLLLALWTILWFLPVWIAKLCGKIKLRDRFISLFCSGMLCIFGITLKTTGKLSELRPLLVVSNHLTYMDIIMLGSHAALRFTPKIEIGKWPLINWICRLTDSVFIDRRPEKLKEASQRMRDILGKGDVISLFPESTTGNGLHLLPFKSGFFSLAETPINGQELHVQPVALTYTHIRRLPVDSTQWPAIAWYGDMYLAPHLWTFLKLGSVTAELVFLPPVTLSQYGDRKKLAAYCQKEIADTIESIRNIRERPSQKTLTSLLSKFSRLKS